MMLEVSLEADEEWDSSGANALAWEQLVSGAASAAVAESAFPQLATGERTVEIAVRLTSDEAVRRLNAEWRGKDKATNVLSFPMAAGDELQQTNVAAPELLLGDIVLAHGVCKAEAADKGVPIQAHASHLVVHGALHLLGYDHADEAGATDMEAREGQIGR